MKNKRNPTDSIPDNQPTGSAASEPETETVGAPEVAPEVAPAEPAELDKLKKDYDLLNDRYLRTLAEYDNFRRRSQREKELIWADATASIITKLLPILDNFDRAYAFECTDPEYKKGVDMIAASFKDVFTQLEVKEIPAAGEAFDPNFHNAVMHIEDAELGENVVAECLQKGYAFGDRIIRHSMVKVAN